MNEQGKGLIKQTTEYVKYAIILKNKNEAERKMIICQSDNPTLVESFLTNVEDIIECYRHIYRNNYEHFLILLYKLLMKSQDDNLKCKYVNYFPNDDKRKYTIILSVGDLYRRGYGIKYLSENYQKLIIKTIDDDELLMKLYYETGNLFVLCAIKNDEFKKYYLPCWNIAGQVKIIESFESDEVRYAYARLPEYVDYFSELTLSFKGLGYKAEMFKLNADLDDKLMVLDHTSDIKQFNHLLSLLPMSFYKQAYGLQRLQNKRSIISCMDLSDSSMDKNSDLSFSLELEIDARYCSEITEFNCLLNNWKIERNQYYSNLIKIKSPKLKYSSAGFKELKIMCDLLTKYNCYPSMNSSMKIRFNGNYFKTIDEFIKFIMLYTYSEPILNNICNRAGSGFDKSNTIPFYCLLDYLLKCDIKFENNISVREMISTIIQHTTTENYSLNLLGYMNKEPLLEFRMANGELDFDELSMTIILFGKILEKSKLISNLDKKNLAMDLNDRREAIISNCKLLVNCLKEKQSLVDIYHILNGMNIRDINEMYPVGKENDPGNNIEGLLKILFDDDAKRQKYRVRYYANKTETSRNR